MTGTGPRRHRPQGEPPDAAKQQEGSENTQYLGSRIREIIRIIDIADAVPQFHQSVAAKLGVAIFGDVTGSASHL